MKQFVQIKEKIYELIKSSPNKHEILFLIKLDENWDYIVGTKFKNLCKAKKIKFSYKKKDGGILYIASFNASVAYILHAELLSIIDRINSLYGYKIISKIKILQSFS